MANIYVIQNERTGLMARHDTEGQHDGRVTDDVCAAKEFQTHGEANEFNQNFGPEWVVRPLFDEMPKVYVDMSRVYALDEDLGGIPKP